MSNAHQAKSGASTHKSPSKRSIRPKQQVVVWGAAGLAVAGAIGFAGWRTYTVSDYYIKKSLAHAYAGVQKPSFLHLDETTWDSQTHAFDSSLPERLTYDYTNNASDSQASAALKAAFRQAGYTISKSADPTNPYEFSADKVSAMGVEVWIDDPIRPASAHHVVVDVNYYKNLDI